MFDKSLNELGKDDLLRLISEATEETQYLEFKEAVPSDDAHQLPSRRHGQSLTQYGRNKLMEEIAAFANAFGGELVIGISETKTEPKRAEALSPIDSPYELADRLRNAIVDCIEPPLPRSQVKVVETEANMGVVVVSVTRSSRGPHRVKGTNKVPIRRDRSCHSMSMPEIIERSRNQERLPPHLEKAIRAIVHLPSDMVDIIDRMIPSNVLSLRKDERIKAWAQLLGVSSFVGLRAVAFADDYLRIQRLESFDGLLSHKTLLRTSPSTESIPLAYPQMAGLPIIDGVEAEHYASPRMTKFTVLGSGYVETTSIFPPKAGCFTPDWLASHVAATIAIFDQMRKLDSVPLMEGQLLIDLNIIGLAKVVCGDSTGPRPLQDKIRLQRLHLKGPDLGTEAMNSCVDALCSAAGLKRDQQSRYELH